MTGFKRWICRALLFLAAGCAASPPLPAGEAAHALFPAARSDGRPADYRIGAQDRINIIVFNEPDLSLQNVAVDASGNILLPLIGAVGAAGKTSGQLSAELAERLGARFLVDPQVSVIVASSMAQKVTVDGAVAQPGVYEVRGRTTLLESLAMAQGPNRVAALDRVAIFRSVEGRRVGALFDVRAIRRGEAPDPEIRGNDTIVVGPSDVKAVWRDFLTAAPALAILRPLGG